jgi:ribonuclease R
MYRLADAVRVKVVRVDLDERKVDFELVEQTVSKHGGKSGRAVAGGKTKAAQLGQSPQARKPRKRRSRKKSGGKPE